MPLTRQIIDRPALIAQLVEHVLGKNGVMGSNPIEGSGTGYIGVLIIVRFLRRNGYGEAEI